MFRSSFVLPGLLVLGTPFVQEPAPVPAFEVLPAERGEFFMLEQVGADGLTRPAGALVLSHREEDGERALELEMHFTEGDLFVRAVETRSDAGERLVWREYGERALRTVVATLPATESALEVSTWGMGEPIHRSITTEWTVRFPLACIEALRKGEEATEVARIWPLSSQVEIVKARRIDLDSPEVPSTWCASIAVARSEMRGYQLVRADGSEAESFLFDGEELVALFLQPGGLCARRVDGAQYREITARVADPASVPVRWEELGQASDARSDAK